MGFLERWLFSRIIQLLENIMANQEVLKEKLTRVDENVTAFGQGVTNVAGDVTRLHARIEELIAAGGVVDPEIEALVDSLVERTATLKEQVVALDAQTPEA